METTKRKKARSARIPIPRKKINRQCVVRRKNTNSKPRNSPRPVLTPIYPHSTHRKDGPWA